MNAQTMNSQKNSRRSQFRDFEIHPAIPPLLAEDIQDGRPIRNLITILKERRKSANVLRSNLYSKFEDFRTGLHDVEGRQETLKEQNALLEQNLDNKARHVQALEEELSSLEYVKTVLTHRIEEQNENLKWFEAKLDKLQQLLAEAHHNKKAVEEKFRQKLESEREKARRSMERQLAKKQAELENLLRINNAKFKLLEEILHSEPDADFLTKYSQTKAGNSEGKRPAYFHSDLSINAEVAQNQRSDQFNYDGDCVQHGNEREVQKSNLARYSYDLSANCRHSSTSSDRSKYGASTLPFDIE